MREPKLDILFEDEDFVAVNKPAGLATIPGRAETDSVLERIGRQIGLPSAGTVDPRIRVVHRLDKETSGVLLFAKNRTAQQHVSAQFQNNLTAKEYLALVVGQPGESSGEINASLAPHRSSPQRMTVTKHGGRPAKTEWKQEQRYRDYTLLRVFPKTGKTHQIRVHLKHVGMPLAIDPLYNPGTEGGIYLSRFKKDYRPTRGEEERPLIGRLTLHAEKLRFRNRGGEEVEIVAAAPKDFRAVVNMLGRHSGR